MTIFDIAPLAGLVSASVALITLLMRFVPWLQFAIETRLVSSQVRSTGFSRQDTDNALRYYIHPHCQSQDPSLTPEPTASDDSISLFALLDDFVQTKYDRRHLMLLADSGIGKTSAILNYYVRHLRRVRRRFQISVVPLSHPAANDAITSCSAKYNTVLLLDALDEDPQAQINFAGRLNELIKATANYKAIIISCRTQFLNTADTIPSDTGLVRPGPRPAGVKATQALEQVFLSPFSDIQIERYIRKRYPAWRPRRRSQARQTAARMRFLAARPMLLAHIDELLGVAQYRVPRYSCELYEAMIDAWLIREEPYIKSTSDLRRFSELLAVDLYVNADTRHGESITAAALKPFAEQCNIHLDEWRLRSRSLLNRGVDNKYKFSHRSILEYLFVKRWFDGDEACLNVEWTTQMSVFAWEMLMHACDTDAWAAFDRRSLGLCYSTNSVKRLEAILLSALRDARELRREFRETYRATALSVLQLLADPEGKFKADIVVAKVEYGRNDRGGLGWQYESLAQGSFAQRVTIGGTLNDDDRYSLSELQKAIQSSSVRSDRPHVMDRPYIESSTSTVWFILSTDSGGYYKNFRAVGIKLNRPIVGQDEFVDRFGQLIHGLTGLPLFG